MSKRRGAVFCVCAFMAVGVTFKANPAEPVRSAAADEVAIPLEGPGGFFGDAYVNGGRDSNANSTSETARDYYFDLFPEQRSSKTSFIGVGASAGYLTLPEPALAWRNSLSATARKNPNANFANSAYLNAQSQLRWTRGSIRTSGALFFTRTYYEELEANYGAGLSLQLEKAGQSAFYAVGSELASWRFPHAEIRDVDSLLLRASIGDPPRSPYDRWTPLLYVIAGTEDARRVQSPYGRDFWGGGTSVGYLMGVNLEGLWSLDALRSEYDGRFTSPDPRRDTRLSGGLTLRWRPVPDSPWASAVGMRIERNLSSEPLYDTKRFLVTLELSRRWRPQATPSGS